MLAACVQHDQVYIFVGRPSNISIMYRPDTYHPDDGELDAAREQLVSYSNRLLIDGLALGSAGNISVRIGDTVLITPSSVPYPQMRPEQVCTLQLAPSPTGEASDAAGPDGLTMGGMRLA